MVTRLNTRQSINSAATPMIGGSAGEQLSTLVNKTDAKLAQLFEDRNVTLADGGTIAYSENGETITCSEDLLLHINSRVSGGSPVVINLGSFFSMTSNGYMVYAVIDRSAGTATVHSDSSTLPDTDDTNSEVFLIAKRIDSADGRFVAYLRDGSALQAGLSTRLGHTTTQLDSDFSVVSSLDMTSKMDISIGGDPNTKTTLYFSQTQDRNLIFPDVSDSLVARSSVDTLSNKKINFSSNTNNTATGLDVTIAAQPQGITRLTNSSLQSISGISTGFSGEFRIIENNTGVPIVIQNNHSGAIAQDRIITGTQADLTLEVDASISLVHDFVDHKWRVVGGSGSAGGNSSVLFNIDNNQSSPADITGATVSSVSHRGFVVDYAVSRVHQTVGGGLDAIFNAASEGSKIENIVYSSCVQADGKLLVGGSFINYDGVSARNKLIRLNANGTLDTAFCANASDGAKFGTLSGGAPIFAIKQQADGKLLIGGAFIDYGGTSGRNGLIRLNSDGTLDTAFCANASDGNKFLPGTVNDVDIQSDGKIIVCGGFDNYSGTSGRSKLVRLNSDGTLDTAFCVNASDGSKFTASINKAVIQANDQIIVGGSFTNHGGTSGRNRLVRLNSDGTLDTAFCVNASDGSKFNGIIVDFTVDADSNIYVGGFFENYGGVSGRSRLVKFDALGVVDASFCANSSDGAKFNNTVRSVRYDLKTDRLYVGGSFTNYDSVTGDNYLAILDIYGQISNPMMASISSSSLFNDVIYNIEMFGDKILIGGDFTNYQTSGRNRFVSILNDSFLDLQEVGYFRGRYKTISDEWVMADQDYSGDESGVTFSVTPLGQIQYASSNLGGSPLESSVRYILKKI